MTTTYSAAIQSNNKTTGRLASPTQLPTVAAYNFLTGAPLGAGTWTEITTGAARVSISLADDDLDVLFTVVMHEDDEDAFDDCVALHDRADVASILTDTGTTLPAAIAAQTAALQGADGDTLETLSDQMDAVAVRVASQYAGVITDGQISVQRGSTWEISYNGYTVTASPTITAQIANGSRYSFGFQTVKGDETKYQFAVKHSTENEDSESVLFVDSETGLLTLNGVAQTTPEQQALVTLAYDGEDPAAGVFELDRGTFIVTADVVRAVA